MKNFIYILLVFTNCFVINSFHAQAQWCNARYRVDTTAYNPQPFGIGTPIPIAGDTFSTVIPIGFNFAFFENNFSYVVISPNGYLSFDTSLALMPSQTYPSNLVPSIQNPLNAVFLFFSYLNSSVISSITYSTVGSTPNRKFVVSFDSLLVAGSGDTCSGQIILNETSNVIELYIAQYYDLLLSGGFLEGVQNDNATLAETARNIAILASVTAINDGRKFTYDNFPYPAPSICMVSVDSTTNKNMVVWNKPPGIAIDSFLIYRETSVSGVYTQIGNQPYSAFSTFIDTGSVPAQQANRYKIEFRDSCGIVSAISAKHKTVHLTISQGSGNTWNLIWDAYEGFTFGSYNIYRGAAPNNMTLLTSIASTLYSYTDLNPPVGTVYYVIEVVNPGGCSPSIISSNSSSYSNITNSGIFSGIPVVANASAVKIFPNPVANNEFTITYNPLPHSTELLINNMEGKEVARYHLSQGSSEQHLNFPKLAAGIYIARMPGDRAIDEVKFVVE